jgi:hypothetical protein
MKCDIELPDGWVLEPTGYGIRKRTEKYEVGVYRPVKPLEGFPLSYSVFNFVWEHFDGEQNWWHNEIAMGPCMNWYEGIRSCDSWLYKLSNGDVNNE